MCFLFAACLHDVLTYREPHQQLFFFPLLLLSFSVRSKKEQTNPLACFPSISLTINPLHGTQSIEITDSCYLNGGAKVRTISRSHLLIKCFVMRWHAQILNEIINKEGGRLSHMVPLEKTWIIHRIMIFRWYLFSFFPISLPGLKILFCMLWSVVLSCVFIKVLLPLAPGPICALCLCLRLLGLSQSGCMCHFLCKPTPV